MKKRVVSLLLCLIMALSLIPTVAFAAEPVVDEQPVEETLIAGSNKIETASIQSPLKLGWMYANITNDSGTLKVSSASSDKDFSKNVTVTLERFTLTSTMDKGIYSLGMPAYDENNKVTVTAKGDYYIAYVAFCCQGSYSYVFINPYDCTAPQQLYADNGSKEKSVSFTLKQLRDMQKPEHEEYCWLMVMLAPTNNTPVDPDPTGTLTIKKQVVGNVNSSAFKINVKGTNYDLTQEVMNGESVLFENLPFGTYTITEIDAAIDGYSLTTTYDNQKVNSYNVTLEAGKPTVPVAVTNTYTMVTGDDVVAPASLTIKKVDATADAKLLSGAKFKLLDTTDSNKYYIETTDTNGSLTFNNIPEGIYTLMETEAPANYIKSNTTWAVKVERTGTPEYILNQTTKKYDAHYHSNLTVTANDQSMVKFDNNTLTVTNAPKNATTVKINITKNVKVTGNTQPTAMPAFTFNINVGTKTLKAVPLTPVKQADGTWKVSQDVDVVVPYDDFDANGVATLTISEVKGTLTNWTYDGNAYTLKVTRDGKEYKETVIINSVPAEVKPIASFTFTNTYSYTYTPPARPSDPIRRQPTTTTTTKPVKSVKTGDMGIALYAVTSLLSLSGTALLIKKRKDEK